MTDDQPRIAGIDTEWTADDEAALEGAFVVPFAEPVTLEVYGAPQTQGNKTGFIRGGKVVLVEGRRPVARENFKSWRQGVTAAAQQWQSEHNVPLLDTACSVTVTFHLQRPKSAPRRRIYPETGLDVDKLARAVLDSLTAVLFTNDARVCDLLVMKRFAGERPPGATITLARMDT